MIYGPASKGNQNRLVGGQVSVPPHRGAMLYSSPASHQMLALEEGKAVSCAHQLIFTKCFEDEMLIIVSCALESLSSGDFKVPISGGIVLLLP